MAPTTHGAQKINDLPTREARPIAEDIRFLNCTPFFDYPTLFPYQADADTNAKACEDAMDRDKQTMDIVEAACTLASMIRKQDEDHTAKHHSNTLCPHETDADSEAHHSESVPPLVAFPYPYESNEWSDISSIDASKLSKKLVRSRWTKKKERIYTEPNPNDIGLGWLGFASRICAGTGRYWSAIEEARFAYKVASKRRTPITSQEIVETMMGEGRRFLKREASGPRMGAYYLVSKNRAIRRTERALREENTAQFRVRKYLLS